eukprot:10856275-Heterocapsa_arctica.AAC.1
MRCLRGYARQDPVVRLDFMDFIACRNGLRTARSATCSPPSTSTRTANCLDDLPKDKVSDTKCVNRWHGR